MFNIAALRNPVSVLFGVRDWSDSPVIAKNPPVVESGFTVLCGVI
jgi:hypothetical protein